MKEEAERCLREHADKLRARDLAVREIVREGYPASVIAEEATEEKVDMIVMGSRGLSGLKHLLLGSVAERVVQKAHCPVLTVNHPDDSPESRTG